MYWTELQCVGCVKLVSEVIQCSPFGAQGWRNLIHPISWKLQHRMAGGGLSDSGKQLCFPSPAGWHTLNHVQLNRLKNIQDSSLRSRWQHPQLVLPAKEKKHREREEQRREGLQPCHKASVSLPSSPGHRIGRRGGISEISWEARRRNN